MARSSLAACLAARCDVRRSGASFGLAGFVDFAGLAGPAAARGAAWAWA